MSISVFKINSEIQSIGDPAKLFVKVHFGSLADLFADSSLMAAFAWKADVNRAHFDANQWAAI